MATKKENERFEKIYSQGKVSGVEILLDKETGVQYVCRWNGYGGGMTVLLDETGRPVIAKKTADTAQ